MMMKEVIVMTVTLIVNDESNTMFSTVLKITAYSDSETSPSKLTATEAPDYAQSESPQHAYYKLCHSVFREIQYTDSETDKERVQVSNFVKNYVEETEDTSPDSYSDSGTEAKVTEVSETDPYETESQTDEPGNNQYTSVENDTEYSQSETEEQDTEIEKSDDSEDSANSETEQVKRSVEALENESDSEIEEKDCGLNKVDDENESEKEEQNSEVQAASDNPSESETGEKETKLEKLQC